MGNVTSVTDGNNNITSYIYDQLNRLSVLTNPFGDKVTTSYDAVGNVTSVTDELGRTTHFTYDQTDQLVDADHSVQGDKSYVVMFMTGIIWK